ncbi:hypothetical protein RJ55_04441 [Drechmeria coniospora]|nr:hypothetical protein RJ55_04441 [Drechmeria coniospora]
MHDGKVVPGMAIGTVASAHRPPQSPSLIVPPAQLKHQVSSMSNTPRPCQRRDSASDLWGNQTRLPGNDNNSTTLADVWLSSTRVHGAGIACCCGNLGVTPAFEKKRSVCLESIEPNPSPAARLDSTRLIEANTSDVPCLYIQVAPEPESSLHSWRLPAAATHSMSPPGHRRRSNGNTDELREHGQKQRLIRVVICLFSPSATACRFSARPRPTLAVAFLATRATPRTRIEHAPAGTPTHWKSMHDTGSRALIEPDDGPDVPPNHASGPWESVPASAHHQYRRCRPPRRFLRSRRSHHQA